MLRSSTGVVIFLAVLLLAGCAMYTPRSQTGETMKPEWVNMGVSTDGLVLHELDKASIVHSGDLVDFMDRKTILDSKNPRRITYQYINWQMHCAKKTLRIKAVRLYDGQQQLIKEKLHDLDAAQEVPIVSGSVGDKQYRIVCAPLF
ncbi:MAG: hypothetical protein IPK86_01830 [Neisseriales bacterium]|nr:MAG: hypothetical protein IPK86_01830 [Neisseriales bacterium]